MSEKKKLKDIDNSDSFEKNVSRLKKIVEILEKGGVTLEKAVLLFQEGQTLAKNCRSKLEKARLDVSIAAGNLEAENVLDSSIDMDNPRFPDDSESEDIL